MNRRDTLKLMALYAGGTASLSTLASLLSGCDAPRNSQGTYVFKVLKPDQAELFAHVAELIIPESDTPGATEAGVHLFADHLLAQWYPARARQVFLDGLAALNAHAVEEFDDPFIHIGADRQTEMLSNLQSNSNGIWMPRNEDETPSFIAMARFMTIVGYYTSEIGATQELRTRIVPGGFKTCIPYDKIGRAWADA